MAIFKGKGDQMSIDREKQILEILLKEKKVSVRQLADALFISEPSVRRDLQRLEKQNLINASSRALVTLDRW